MTFEVRRIKWGVMFFELFKDTVVMLKNIGNELLAPSVRRRDRKKEIN
jgi:hypothetical protein